MKPKSAFQRARSAARGQRAAVPIGLALAFWIAAAVIVGGLLVHQKNEILGRATRNAGALALVLEAHTARTLQTVDAMLAGVADALRMSKGLAKHDPAFRAALAGRLVDLQPYVRALFVIGPDGWIIHDTDYPNTPNVTLADRAYFQAHRNDPTLERSVSSPLQSRSGLGWFLAVTRRVGRDGEFGGIAVAAVQPQYFEALYRRMGLSQADVITLYHRDGTLIARYPGGEDVGRSFAGFDMFTKHLPSQSSGSYVTDRGVLDYPRLVSYRALEGEPLVVAVAQDMASLLEAWRLQAIGAAIGLGGLMVLLAALVALFLRHQRLRDIARERSAQSEKLEALGHFTGSVSHDFSNLLNVMSASLRVLGLGSADPQRTREALAVGERAVMRGAQLIERLRSFARRQPLYLREVNLNTLVREGGGLLRQLLGPQVRLEEDLASELPPCVVDETELEVALVNLLVNARDAGARRITLRTYDCSAQAKPPGWRSERASDYVCLAVCDDGPGMPESVRRRAIEPYFTTKGRAGTGLGLSQVYGFMRQIGGDVHIESLPGRGTSVHLIFPKAGGPASPHPAGRRVERSEQ